MRVTQSQSWPTSEKIATAIGGEAKPLYKVRTPGLLCSRENIFSMDIIRKAIESWVKDKITTVTYEKDGFGSLVYRVIVAKKTHLVAKIRIFQDTVPLESEFAFLCTLQSTTLALIAPRPFVLDCSGKLLPVEFMIIEELPGLSIAALIEDRQRLQMDKIVAEIGTIVASVHNVSPSKRERLFSETCAAVDRGLRNETRSSEESIGDLFTEKVQLHGDPSLRNFLISDGRITGLIDGPGTIGNRMSEVARFIVFLFIALTPVLKREIVIDLIKCFLCNYQKMTDSNGWTQLPLWIQYQCKRRAETAKKLNRLGDIPLVRELSISAPEILKQYLR